MEDKMKRVASIMAARYVNASHSAAIKNDWNEDPSWVIRDCVNTIDKEVSGFKAEFIMEERKFRQMIERFTPEMIKQARQMFAEKA